MDNLAIIKRIEIRLSEINMSKADFYKLSGISSASLSQWRTGVYSPTRKKLESAAECLGLSYEYLAYGAEETEKTPALTDKDERDIARSVGKIMDDLASSGDLMFDGVPMSEEAKAAMAAAIRVGLEEAKRRNKETYTPKKCRKE